VSPRGGKWWRAKYQLGGRDKRLSLGVFPMVGLKLARLRCLELRSQLRSGVLLRQAGVWGQSRTKQDGAGSAREFA
jgi:hypothetical protein